MHVAVRELAVLAVAVAAGSAEAFAPAPSGLGRLRAAPSVGLSTCERGLPSARRDVAPALGTTALQAVANGNLIGKVVPRTLKEGADYVKASKVSVGDLVLVNRSDGTLRYGEVIDAGGFFSSGIEVCVEMDNGEAGFSKVEALGSLFVPTQVPSVTVSLSFLVSSSFSVFVFALFSVFVCVCVSLYLGFTQLLPINRCLYIECVFVFVFSCFCFV